MATRLGGKNWADVDEEDDDEIEEAGNKAKGARCFETPVDGNGIKTVIEYKEREGKTYKVTRRVRQNTLTKWTNQEMIARRELPKFGKVKGADPVAEASHCTKSVEDVNIELSRKQIQVSQANEAEDKFYEEALKACESLFKEKKVWTEMNRDNMVAKDEAAATAAPAATAAASTPAAPAAAAAPGGGPAKYVPPSVRAAEKGGGKGKDFGPDASLRITNLCEDVKEGDLQELFSPFGRLQRVYLAKDPVTHLSKGFAFVTYYERKDAQKAIDKLNGHGYDNLILQVQWAKPKA